MCGQERSSRALSVAEKKAASKLSAVEKSHAIEIENKNKEIKVELLTYEMAHQHSHQLLTNTSSPS